MVGVGQYGQELPMYDKQITTTQLYFCIRDCCINCPYYNEQEHELLGWSSCKDKLMEDAFYWLDTDPVLE